MMQTQDECAFPPSTFGSPLWADESGQDMAEYAVLIAFLALAVMVATALLGGTIANTFNDIGSSMSGAIPD